MTLSTFLIIVGTFAIGVNIVAAVYGLYVLLSGSYKDYAEMRAKHIAQSQRVREALQRGQHEI